MKVLFVGGLHGNSGPDNVNKRIIENLDERFLCVKSRKKILKYLELYKIFICDVVVISGLSKLGVTALHISKLLHKKTLYLMHGCVEYESGINGFKNVQKPISQERHLMKETSRIVAVSEKFKSWIVQRYPQYEGKVLFLYNGVDRINICYENCERDSRRIIAIGGDRKIKNNAPVCEAAEELDGKVYLDIYGTVNFKENAKEYKYSSYRGQVSQQELYTAMCSAQVFVLNSVFESFSLAAIEALECGCSILISNIAGVTDLLKLQEEDKILDPFDKDEIASKISYLVDHPNNKRVKDAINWGSISYKARVNELFEICRKVKINE